MTLKQKRAAKKVVENGGNVTKAMREVGYSEATVNNPSNLTKSKGFKEVLEASGLTDNLVVTSLVEDIKNKPQDRARELYLAMELLGMKQKALVIETGESRPINVISFRDYHSGQLEKMSNEELEKLADGESKPPFEN